MALPPYPGQGNRLPETTTFVGEWIIEDKVFIFRTNPPGSRGEFAGILLPDGEECDGFDADLLAALLEITAEELFATNRAGLLKVEFRSVAAALGADSTIEYTIQTPSTGVRQRVCRAAIKGRA